MQAAAETQVKASELRIGNYLYKQEDPDEPLQVIKVDKYTFEYDVWDWYKGISITPELLQACGFEKMGNRYHISGSLFYIVEVEGRFYVEYSFGAGHAFTTTYLLRLHQLQNYFFAVEHRELEITL